VPDGADLAALSACRREPFAPRTVMSSAIGAILPLLMPVILFAGILFDAASSFSWALVSTATPGRAPAQHRR
jgi:hypothetical protein